MAKPKAETVKKVQVKDEAGKWRWTPENEVPEGAEIHPKHAPVPEPVVVEPLDTGSLTSTVIDDGYLDGEWELPPPSPLEDSPLVPERAMRGAVGDDELSQLLDRHAIERAPAQQYQTWYHPWLRNVEIRPTHNAAIRFQNYRFTPKTQNEDAFVRLWVWKQRGKNDPERWHGDTPGLIDDLECGFCHAKFGNQAAYQDHLRHDHLREELADQRVR